MADSVKEQIFVLAPFLGELRAALTAKDRTENEGADAAQQALDAGDVEPAVDLIIRLLRVKNTSVVSVCVRALVEMFLSKNFEFFLAAHHAKTLLHSLIHLLQVMRPKAALCDDVAQCLTLFLISPNQQLYVHGEELEYALTSLLGMFEKKTLPKEKKLIETVLKRVMHNIESLAMRSVDEFVASDYRDMIIFLVRALAASEKAETQILVIELIERTVFEAPQDLKKTAAHRQVLLVEIPQLFIQSALIVPDDVFERLFELYKKFIDLGDQVVTSFSMIIGEMITPAIDAGDEKALRALSLVSVLNSTRPDLLMVFALCDCSNASAKRVFEDLFQAISKYTMDNVANSQIVGACLDVLFFIMAAYQRHYMKLDEGKAMKDAKVERDVIEQKLTTEGCAKVFNQSPKKGVMAIVKSGLADDNPESLAKFLKECSLLDPVKLSEYLAGGKANDVLSAFVNLYDFKSLTLDAALRELCASYRLPGESQQIDRVMQCFASKYHKDNPDGMSEDAAYVISFSIIMLHTDIYNPNVVRKITCEEWIRNTRHVKEACEVDVEVLKGMYDRVVSKPMKLTEGTLSPTAEANQLRNRSRKQLKKLMARSESQEIPVVTRELYLLAIERLWSTIFAALSLSIQGTKDIAIVEKALRCLEVLVFFLAKFSMSKELQTIITFLCSVCNFPGTEVVGLTAMVNIVKANGDGVRDSWYPILDLFSKVARPFLPPNHFQPLDETAPTTMLPCIEGAPISDIESVYSDSLRLDRDSFMSFLRALCQISTAEIFENPPSLFTLIQIIDVCIVNINRVRFVWSQAWSVFSEHFCRIGCLLHEQISIAAIEGLSKVARMLSANSEKWQHFQSDILAPYLVIFQNQPMVGPKKVIVRDLFKWLDGSLVMDSAWDVVLDILQVGANDESAGIVMKTYQILEANIPYIPEKFNPKLFVALLLYASQTKVAKIKGPSMAYVTTVGMKIDPVTPNLLTAISSVLLGTENPEVIGFATKLLFMLIPKLTVSWETIESQHILPLFSTPHVGRLTTLIKEFFESFLPEMEKEALGIIPKITSIFIELNNARVVELFTEFVVLLSTRDSASDRQVSVETLMTLLRSQACSSPLLMIVISKLTANSEVFDVFDLCVEKAMDLQNIRGLLDALSKLMSLMDEQHAARLADVIVRVLQFANTIIPEQGLPVVQSLHTILTGPTGVAFLKPVRTNLQQALFEFFLNKSPAIRTLARDLALASQSLFL